MVSGTPSVVHDGLRGSSGSAAVACESGAEESRGSGTSARATRDEATRLRGAVVRSLH